MISREKKEKSVEDLAAIVSESASVIFTDFSGLSTNDLNELKSNLRSENVHYKVTKKSLWPFVMKKAGLNEKVIDFSKHKGSVGIAYSSDEGVGSAKVIAGFIKNHKEFSILGGFMEKLFVSNQKIAEWAELPSREELLSRFVFALSDPIRSFAGVLGGAQRDFVSVINQIKESKE